MSSRSVERKFSVVLMPYVAQVTARQSWLRTLRTSTELRVLKHMEDGLEPSCSRKLASLMLLLCNMQTSQVSCRVQSQIRQVAVHAACMER